MTKETDLQAWSGVQGLNPEMRVSVWSLGTGGTPEKSKFKAPGVVSIKWVLHLCRLLEEINMGVRCEFEASSYRGSSARTPMAGKHDLWYVLGVTIRSYECR